MLPVLLLLSLLPSTVIMLLLLLLHSSLIVRHHTYIIACAWILTSCNAVHIESVLPAALTAHCRLQVVEATAASGAFTYKFDIDSIPETITSIRDYLAVIPTMTAIHGQDTWGGQHVSEKYGDHIAWDASTIVTMLTEFFNVTGAVSVPDLEEYAWRLDKVSLVLTVLCVAHFCGCHEYGHDSLRRHALFA